MTESDLEQTARDLVQEMKKAQGWDKKEHLLAEALRDARRDGVRALADHYEFHIDPDDVLDEED